METAFHRTDFPMRHGGRWQAQGGDLEKSVAWNGRISPSQRDMLEMLQELRMQLSAREQQERRTALMRAQGWSISRTAAVFAPFAKSWVEQRGSDMRIDPEIKAGWAYDPLVGNHPV